MPSKKPSQKRVSSVCVCGCLFVCFVLFCFLLFCFVLFCFVCLFVCLFVFSSLLTPIISMYIMEYIYKHICPQNFPPNQGPELPPENEKKTLPPQHQVVTAVANTWSDFTHLPHQGRGPWTWMETHCDGLHFFVVRRNAEYCCILSIFCV